VAAGTPEDCLNFQIQLQGALWPIFLESYSKPEQAYAKALSLQAFMQQGKEIIQLK
jgi:hypothetical protein